MNDVAVTIVDAGLHRYLREPGRSFARRFNAASPGSRPSTHLDRVGHPAANLVISNVPGASETRYLNGARLVGIYPVSAHAASIGLNATLTSYHDRMDFGFIANAVSLYDLPQLARHTLATYEELKTACVPGRPG